MTEENNHEDDAEAKAAAEKKAAERQEKIAKAKAAKAAAGIGKAARKESKKETPEDDEAAKKAAAREEKIAKAKAAKAAAGIGKGDKAGKEKAAPKKAGANRETAKAPPKESAPSEEAVDATTETSETAAAPGEPPEPQLSTAFPLLVVALQLGFAYYFLTTSTTPMRTYMGIGVAPIVATIVLAIWWLRARAVPIEDRLLGLLMAVGAIALPMLTAWPVRIYFLVYLLPAVTTSVVLVAVATRGVDWSVRRKGLSAALGICLVFFCFTRVVGVNGVMAPLLDWRWSGAASLSTVENERAAVAAQATPEDWPGFRGADRNSRNMVDRFGIDWANEPPKELWRRPVGEGWSSFAVVGDYCFTQEQRGDREAVVCYEVATGEPVWVNTVKARLEDVMGNGPRATPTYHKGKLYTQGATGIFQCIDAATGQTLWKKDIEKEGQTEMPQWGFSSSPLIAGDLVVAFAGGGNGKSLLAYNQVDGKLAWTAGKGAGGYSSPHLGEMALTPQILQLSNYGIETFDPKTGAPLWAQEWKLSNSPRCVQPYILDLYQVFAGTGQGEGVRLIKAEKDTELGTWTIETRWTSERFRPYFNDFVYYNGFCYGYDGNRIACMDTTDGKVRWTGERHGGQVLLIHTMEMLVVLTEKGEVLLIPAFPEEGNIVARMQALDGKTWNHPVVSGGKLFVRNATEAACYELPPPPPEPAEEGEDNGDGAH